MTRILSKHVFDGVTDVDGSVLDREKKRYTLTRDVVGVTHIHQDVVVCLNGYRLSGKLIREGIILV